MAKTNVFYSWQSDLPPGTNRTFIESCLNKAIKELRASGAKLDPCLDRDTANVPGSPDIASTILDKIDNCHVFVCDTTIVQSSPRATPNPNVLFELGYAVKTISWDRVICVANEHFGEVGSLPFDVRQRRVLRYTLSPDAADRSEVSRSLTDVLRRELEKILMAPRDEGERLQIHFADVDTRTPLGQTLKHRTVFYECDIDNIADFRYDEERGAGGILGTAMLRGAANRDYNRQLAQFIQHAVMTRKIGFVVFNGNSIPLNDITMKLVLPKGNGLVVLNNVPARPSQSSLDMISRGIRPSNAYFARPGKLTLDELPDRYEIRVEFGKIQAESNGWSDAIYIGTSHACNLALSAELYADELAAPAKVALELEFDVARRSFDSLTDDEFVRLMADQDRT